MISKISEIDHNNTVELCRRMTPEQRLVAFFNHSQLVSQLHQAGIHFRARSQQKDSQNSHEN